LPEHRAAGLALESDGRAESGKKIEGRKIQGKKSHFLAINVPAFPPCIPRLLSASDS
jgi:hypothetical protein